MIPHARGVVWLVLVLASGVGVTTVRGTDNDLTTLQREFAGTVSPFLRRYCDSCHHGGHEEARLDLSAYLTYADAVQGERTWQAVWDRLSTGDMPPADAELLPDEGSRRAVVGWIERMRRFESRRQAGDPGLVAPRRLSHAEYDCTIRDLTGVDIRPAREFPVDPANESGFDNSAESLATSPPLVKKYLDAARYVAGHLVLRPDGFSFAPHPVVTDTDRDKYCVKRIVEFYRRQPTDYAAYFLAAWRFQRESSGGAVGATLEDLARAEGISPKYLAVVWKALAEPREKSGPLAELQSLWRELPVDGRQRALAREGCERMRDFVVRTRRSFEPVLPDLELEGSHKGSQPFVLWKNREYAAHRLRYNRKTARIEVARMPDEEPTPVDKAERAQLDGARARFCAVFPDQFYVSERGRDYVGKSKDEQEKGRLLSAGFHSMMGYFRDDAPLYELVLDAAQQRELDTLWRELDFVTAAPLRQYAGFIWFERTDSRYLRDPEFDEFRAEDKDVTSAEKIGWLAERYLAKARRLGGSEVVLAAIERYFQDINAQIRWVEQARQAAEPSHLQSLVDFAERAYRHPLAAHERTDLLDFYRTLRTRDGLGHEEAIQDVVVSILMSPSFCFRMELARSAEGPRPLSGSELASRLSYFLWSSMPDRELQERAAAGDLHQPKVLAEQVHRMLRDDRVRGLATEFGANWLDFRRFESHHGVDRERFPQFTDELRRAMFEEPIRFFVDVASHDRSVLEFLTADYTFVNQVLARHYGMPEPVGADGGWERFNGADRFQRGGLLPMSVFLTANSPGLRTSPVKRGYWVVRRLLGERIPAPPPKVPELPADERQLGEATLRELLARHREHRQCAGCHDRFDSIGLVFESFGPIGELRDVDLGGRPVDPRAVLPGGSEGQGVAGLRQYLLEHRQHDFLDNLCRKLLSYALGRSIQLSDDPLVEAMHSQLKADDYRFGSLVASIVTSRQFLHKRGGDPPAEE